MRPLDVRLPASLFSSAGPGVALRWLGTAGFEIESEGHVVLIDPYFTRAPLHSLLRGAVVPDADRIAQHVRRADAIVVGHTHFDHVLDTPYIAKTTGAKVFGSRSAATLCRLSNVAESQIVDVEWHMAGAPYQAEVGPFQLRFVPSAHSPFVLGKVPFPGEIADCTDVPMRADHYRCGTVFGVEIRVAGRTIFHLGSAEVVEATFGPAGIRNVDLLLLCVPGWTATPHLPARALRLIDPHAVLLSHWDDFLRPLDAPARLLPAIKMPQLVDALVHQSRSLPIGALDVLETLRM